jgi:hypothetical protein
VVFVLYNIGVIVRRSIEDGYQQSAILVGYVVTSIARWRNHPELVCLVVSGVLYKIGVVRCIGIENRDALLATFILNDTPRSTYSVRKTHDSSSNRVNELYNTHKHYPSQQPPLQMIQVETVNKCEQTDPDESGEI